MTYLSVIAGAAALVAVSAVPANVQTCGKQVDKSLTSNNSVDKSTSPPAFLSRGRAART